MRIEIDPGWLTLTLLLTIRFSVLFAFTPLLTTFAVPVRIRVVLAFGLAMMATAMLGQPTSQPEYGLSSLITMGAVEVINGAALALGVLLAFAPFMIAGRLIDQQMAFGIGQMLDQLNRVQMPVMTNLFSYLGVLLFFLLDLHHHLLRGMVASAQLVPVGQVFEGLADMPRWILGAGAMFSTGVALVLPIVVGLLLTDLVLAVIARNIPQMNVLVLGFSLKIVVGLILLSLWMPLAVSGMQIAFKTLFEIWGQVLQ